MTPTQPDQPDTDSDGKIARGSVEWVRAQLDGMHADWLAGKRYPEDRETILKRLGYGSYETYLFSPLWRRTRRRILKRDNHGCVRCSEKATQVHHLAYTELVLKGEDDSQLVSVCAECHDRIEFDGGRNRRADPEKQRVLEDRDGARQEKIAIQQERLRQQELEERVCSAWGGRCFRCKGDTEGQLYHSDGRVYLIPVSDGDAVHVWACSPCRSEMDHDKDGRARTDEEKLKLLRKKVNVRYTRPAPATGFHFRKTFWQLNARQREGVMNEFHWNAANIAHPDLETTDPERFALLRTRYESTKTNGRGNRLGIRR